MKITRCSLITLTMLVILSISSCEYEPTGGNFVEVDPNVPPIVFDVNLNWEKDTIWWPSGSQIIFRYNFQTYNKEFIEVYLYIDAEKYKSSNSDDGQFKFELDPDVDLDTLNVVFEGHFASGTGSLADKLGGERFIVSKEWALIIYKMDRIYSPDLKLEKIDGQFKISWNELPIDNFQKYTIKKSIDHNKYYQMVEDIYQKDITSMIDPHYIGENAKYEIEVTDDNGIVFKFPGAVAEDKFPKLHYRIMEDNTAEIFWDKCQFQENFDHYSLHNIGNKTIEHPDINDTSCRIEDFPHGSRANALLYVHPKIDHNSNAYGQENYQSRVQFFYGKPFPGFSGIAHAGNEHIVLKPEHRKLYIYNTGSAKVIDSVESDDNSTIYNFNSSTNGEFIVFDDNKELFLIKNLNFNSREKFSFATLLEGSFDNTNITPRIRDISVSDNGIAAISFNSFLVILYDLANRKFIRSFEPDFKSVEDVRISPDGNYLTLTNSYLFTAFYKINDDEINEIQQTDVIKFAQFNPDISSRVLIQIGYKDIKLIELDPFSVLAELSDGKSENLLGADFDLGTFVTTSFSNELNQYSIETGQLLKKINTVRIDDYYLYKNNYLYIPGVIITGLEG